MEYRRLLLRAMNINMNCFMKKKERQSVCGYWSDTNAIVFFHVPNLLILQGDINDEEF